MFLLDGCINKTKALLTKRQFFSIPQNGKLLPALTFIEEQTTIDPLAAF